MRRIVTGLFMSLDGVVDADDGWQFPYFDEDFFRLIEAGQGRTGAVLVGRRSYEGYERVRDEHPDSPALAYLDATPTYVVSSTLKTAPRSNLTIIDHELHERLEQLKREGDDDITVLGSPTLVRWLLTDGLLDELAIIVLPIVVGSGVRLFDSTPVGRTPLWLLGSTTLDSGVIELRYAPTESARI